MTKPNVFTAVFREVTPDEVGEITHHPKWSAASWSHAIDDRKEAEVALQVANARIAELEGELEALKSDNASLLDSLMKESVARCEIEDRIAAAEKQEPVAWRIFDGEGCYDYRDDEPPEVNIKYAAKYGRIYEPLYVSAASNNWQPLATAPKDGSLFLGWVDAVKYGESDEGERFESDVSEVDFCRWQTSECGGYFENLSGPIADAEHITQWMPIPSRPTPNTEQPK